MQQQNLFRFFSLFSKLLKYRLAIINHSVDENFLELQPNKNLFFFAETYILNLYIFLKKVSFDFNFLLLNPLRFNILPSGLVVMPFSATYEGKFLCMRVSFFV